MIRFSMVHRWYATGAGIPRSVALVACPLLVASAFGVTAMAQEITPESAAAALRKATAYFVEEVSTEGGYLYAYSLDLQRRAGEDQATATQAWIQPPGTPAVGMALLDAYDAIGDRYYFEAARQTGEALIRGQLHSGGWDNMMEFDPALRDRYAYRVDGEPSRRANNTTTLDDNKSQSAMRLLMRLDRMLEFKDERLHEATRYALDALVKAQYPNGAWPQRFDEYPKAADYPIRAASYPKTWSRTFPSEKYSGFYTFNDNAMGDALDVMVEAAKTYDEPEYLAAARRAGDFMLLAQMPDPQPAWSQQYDLEMHPAWARKFEPPSITGGESQGVMRALLQLYRETGDRKYLDPVPRALAYLKSSQLSDGRLARFYELETNTPLYFTKDYVLTYSDADMPTHYAFKVSARLDRIEDDYNETAAMTPEQLERARRPRFTASPGRMSRSITAAAAKAIAAMDDQGRWTEDGTIRDQSPAPETIVTCRTFIANVEAISRYLAAARAAR